MSFDDVYKSAKVLYELDSTSVFNLSFPLTVENNKAFMFFSNTSDSSATSITINQNISIRFSKNDSDPKCFGFPFELKTIFTRVINPTISFGTESEVLGKYFS
jgi:hypothetical protein